MSMYSKRLLWNLVWRGGALVLVLAMAGGCASKRNAKAAAAAGGEPDKYLFDRGTESLGKRRWLRAEEYFKQLKDTFPQSAYRSDALLGIGDAYIGENGVDKLILAASEFREFLTYYPTNRRADYAQYKLAVCYYEQMEAAQRDQTQTKEAIREFEKFLERYPTSTLLAEGRKKLRESRDRLSDADYAVGFFYYRARWYPGAIARLRAVLKDNPDYNRRDAVYYCLADSYVNVKLGAEALPLLARLSTEFKKSEYLERAKKLAADLTNPPAAPVKGEKK